MNNINLALCIPTYERSDLVEDFLVKCSEYYIEAGIDIYYYDSSISEETKKLVCGWPDQEHIHYIRLPSELSANAKAYRIFQKYGLKRDYDFIWLSNDGLQCTQEAIEQIVANLKPNYDIIEINATDYKNVGTGIFTDSNEYMKNCAWHLTLFGAAILNAHTMLEDVNWEYYENKFLSPTLSPFSHVSFYFYRILELKQFCALHLSLCRRFIKFSKLKRASGWSDSFFYVLCECWVQTIDSLPNHYTDKRQAMKDLGDMSFIKDISFFYRAKEQGRYSLSTFLSYKTAWNKVTSFPKRRLFLVALTPRSCVKAFYNLRKNMGRKKLQRFCRVYDRIYIYGTGIVGDIYAKYFEKYGLDYAAFCVSHRKMPQQEHLSHPVYEFGELRDSPDNIGFVMAMMEDNVEEVLPSVREAVGGRAVFFDMNFTDDIRHELNYTWL